MLLFCLLARHARLRPVTPSAPQKPPALLGGNVAGPKKTFRKRKLMAYAMILLTRETYSTLICHTKCPPKARLSPTPLNKHKKNTNFQSPINPRQHHTKTNGICYYFAYSRDMLASGPSHLVSPKSPPRFWGISSPVQKNGRVGRYQGRAKSTKVRVTHGGVEGGTRHPRKLG